MKLTLNQKVLAGIIFCSVVLAAIAIFSFRNSEKLVTTNHWVEHTHEVLHEFDALLANTVDEETGVRGFVITGNDSFLEPYARAKTDLNEHLARLRDMTTDNPVQQQNITLLQKQLDMRAQILEDMVLQRRKGFEEAKDRVYQGKEVQDEIRRLVNRGRAMETTLLAQRQQTSAEDTQNFNAVFILLLFVIASVLVAVYSIININLRALKRAELESANKNWLLTGNQQLNEKIRGEREVNELSQSILSHLCAYLDVQVGAIYIFENGTLQPAGGYALELSRGGMKPVRPGEGLVGQAAAEKRVMQFSDVPDDYFKINSSLGSVKPKHLLAIPFLYDGVLKGVAEFGSLKQLTALQLQFLTQVEESIAIVIMAAQSRMAMKDLLEETQRQAEELETQQEELKQANEELQEKTDLLEKSEAELKAQQEELQQTNEELEEKANLLEIQKEKLENAKIDIETKADELEVTNKYKSEFLANMSHELRTPLNSILILSQVLSENKNKSLNDKEVEYAKNVYSSGVDLLNLINEILDLAKVESGKMELDIADTELGDVTTHLSAMFSEVAKNKAIDFNIIADERVTGSIIKTDKQRLEQILRNLLSNAFKFTSRKGKVTLLVTKAAPGKIYKNNNLNKNEHILAFAVTDNGIGIPADKQGIIFEAFQQADGSTKRQFGGTGLGLSISRELAAALGGEIHLVSEEQKGSAFTLYIPVTFHLSGVEQASKKIEVKPAKAAPRTMSRTERLPNPATGSIDDRDNISDSDRSILILEDDTEFAKLLLDFVRERHYKGIIAYEGNTGLSYARYYKPDAIILDMKLPQMDGADVLRQLKIDPALRHIPVQIISGTDRRKEGLALGAFDFIRKPISKDDLQSSFNKIEEFVNRKLKRLLVVEDDEIQNKAIRELVGNGDVKSFPAYNGTDAYEMMTKETFDCVIIDLGLPDMSGYQLMEKIKSHDQLKKVPIIVYTGRDLKKEESNMLNKLADTVVLKTADSNARLLDETTLFLHRVEAQLPKEKQNIIRKLHKTDEVLKGKKVLVVDDDIRNIYSLTNVLEEEGVACMTAENGKVALKVLQENPSVDIVIMDVMMPEMDGYETTKEIRKMDKFARLPIIALTAKAMKGDREKCLSAGMSDYITKPVNIEQLLSLMRVWLYN